VAAGIDGTAGGYAAGAALVGVGLVVARRSRKRR
jgi:MYXO-CTERM domain-containing protein